MRKINWYNVKKKSSSIYRITKQSTELKNLLNLIKKLKDYTKYEYFQKFWAFINLEHDLLQQNF